jgi:hypothetical protein
LDAIGSWPYAGCADGHFGRWERLRHELADTACRLPGRRRRQAAGRRFSVEVKVLGRSALAATVTTADGSILPEQKMASSDRSLTRGSIERFARALAGAVAQAPGP